mmetsp:Transcript_4805/g.7397  ORF Transcript_4805/g.7397 Transcript_4805/m.7397 type:complete len:223 (-) Transcript_4805:204-872(-)
MDAVGRVLANLSAGLASGSMRASVMSHTPSMNTQFHPANVTWNHALMIWFAVSTCPYIIMYLYEASAEASAHRPSLRTSMTEDIFLSTDVNGATTDASASLRAIPTCAAFSAPQSLPPSPHINVTLPRSMANVLTTLTLSCGVHRPKTLMYSTNSSAFAKSCSNIVPHASPLTASSILPFWRGMRPGNASTSSPFSRVHCTPPAFVLLPISTVDSALKIPAS